MVVELKQIVKRYKKTLAVDGVSLSIKKGEIFGLLGPNGAGKTTLIHSLIGITGFDSGEVHILGERFTGQERHIKAQIGLIPQEIALYKDLSAWDNIALFARLYQVKKKDLKKAVEDALVFTGLQDAKSKLPGTFSGGMKRRLNIACGIVHRPKLVIMDEPTVGIDPQSRNHILQSVKTLNKEGTTVIYTSHYMEEVEELCSQVAIMDHGRIIALGSKEELKALINFQEKLVIAMDKVDAQTLEAVKMVSGVKECVVEEGQLTVLSEQNSHNVGRVLESLTASGTDVWSVHIEKPTLEGVFLTLTGRTLRD